MIENKERLVIYLNATVNNIFKILPLFEEENIGVYTYVDSLLFELYGLDKVVDLKDSYEYTSLLSTLESIKIEISKEDGKRSVVRREVFKCINIVKNMASKAKEGE